MSSNYNTTRAASKGTLDAQLANVEEYCPRTVAAFYAIIEDLYPTARQHLGFRSITPIARLLGSWFERHGYGDNVLRRAACEALISLMCNQYRQKTVSNPEQIHRDHIPAPLLMSKLTGHDYETCKKNRSIQDFGAAFYAEVIEPLSRIEVETKFFGRIPLVQVENYSYVYRKPREYDILGLQCAIAEQIQHGWTDKEITARQDYSEPSELSDDFNQGGLKDFTVQSGTKWSRSPFQINENRTKLELHRWIHDTAFENCPDWNYKLDGQKKYLAKLASTLATLGTANLDREGQQYVGPIHMTSCGRLYPEGGGIVNLPKALRWLLIDTPHKYHVLVDIDLKSCQLVALPQILDCPETLEHVLDVIHNGKSLWEHIAPKGFDLKSGKPALKQLIYGFCFGMKLTCLGSETNKKLRKLGLEFQFSKKQIKEILSSPVMAPLVAARESFFEEYSLSAIDQRVAGKRAIVVKNELNLPFNLREHAKEVRANYKRPDQAKAAGQLLAHLAQGAEQAVMQMFIASDIVSEQNDVHLVNFQYDGATISVPMDRVDEVLEQCDEWLKQNHPDHKFEAEVLWFLKNPRFFVHACNLQLATRWITSGDYKRFNRDMRGKVLGQTYLGGGFVKNRRWDGEKSYETIDYAEPPGYWKKVWEACSAKHAAA